MTQVSQGAYLPQTAAQDATGTIPWNIPDDIKTDDSNPASISLDSTGTKYSNILTAQNFGFSVPENATILGIKVSINRRCSSYGTDHWVKDDQLYIIKSTGVLGTTNKASTAMWPPTEATLDYGGAADLWGETWTPADINSASFGVSLKAKWYRNTVAYMSGSVYYIKITVYYNTRFKASGTYTSRVIDNGGVTSQVPTLSWTSVVPEGTTFTMEQRSSVDNVTWTEWASIISGGQISTAHRYVQYKASFAASEDGYSTPSLENVVLAYPDEYYSSGEWISDEIDMSGMVIDTTLLNLFSEVTDGTLVFSMRHREFDSDAWSAWAAQTDGAALTTKNCLYQFKAAFTASADKSYTPKITSFNVLFTPSKKKSTWVSEPIDVSNATSLAGSVVTHTEDTGLAGAVLLYSRSSADGVTWSAWYQDSTGDLQHPDNKYIQLKFILENDVRLDEATIILDDAAAATELTITDGMTDGSDYSFATLSDYLVFTNGVDDPMKWDAETDPAVLCASPPLLSILAVHNNRLWGVDATNKSRVRFSDILDITTWGAYSFMDFNPDDGDQVTALIRWGQNLLVSKHRSMAVVTGDRLANYAVSWLDMTDGVAGKNAICVADNCLAYVAQDGIHFTDLSTNTLASDRLTPLWDETINKRALENAACFYWKNNLFVSLPSSDSLVNDTVWVYDFLRSAWTIYTGWSISHFLSFVQYGEEILLGASSSEGQLYQLLTTTHDDTTDITYTWRSKEFHFNCPEKYKLFRNLFLDLECTSETTTLYVDLLIDGVIMGTYTSTIPAGEGFKTTRRVLPPLYDAVLGSSFAVQLRGKCGVHSMAIEYIVRGNIPGGDF